MSQQRWLVVAGVALILLAAVLFAVQRTAAATGPLSIGVVLTAMSATVGRGSNGRGRD